MNDLTFFLIAVPSVLILSLAIYILIRNRGRAPDFAALMAEPQSAGSRLAGRIASAFGRGEAGDEFWSELECALIEADVGVDVTSRLLSAARQEQGVDRIKKSLSENMLKILEGVLRMTHDARRMTVIVPHVILVVGVNGVGKTTTIAKLARSYQRDGKKVLLVAADTFRAAAAEQLSVWGERLGCEVVSQRTGADSASVAFDGVERARAKGFDVVIIDTAGRLHTKQNLMEELKKIGRVIGRAMPGAPHERLIIIDATVGSNGLSQARQFHEAVDLTGAIVAKMDGTAKGGIVFAIAGELGIPITHIGVGEGMDDLRPFDPEEFVRTII